MAGHGSDGSVMCGANRLLHQTHFSGILQDSAVGNSLHIAKDSYRQFWS